MKHKKKCVQALILIVIVVLFIACQNDKTKQDEDVVWEDISQTDVVEKTPGETVSETAQNTPAQQDSPSASGNSSPSPSPSNSDEERQYNGTYTAELSYGTEIITITNYTSEGFDFAFETEPISGHASYSSEYPEDANIAYYTGAREQCINFEFNETGVTIGGGVLYGGLAGHYTPQ